MSGPAPRPLLLVRDPALVLAYASIQPWLGDRHFVREALAEQVYLEYLRREEELLDLRILPGLHIGRRRERRPLPQPRAAGLAPTLFVVTALGYTTLALPPGSRLRVTTVGGGGGGGGGHTADNSANRKGGGGGASSAIGQGTWSRRRLPDTLYAFVGAGGAHGTPVAGAGAGERSLVEVTNTTFDGSSTPQASSTVCYSGGVAGAGAQGLLSGAGGTASTVPASTGAYWTHLADSFSPFVGLNGGTAGDGAAPSDLTPFSTTSSLHSPGCGGGGKSTTTAFAGGRHAAVGHLAATVGGTAPGGAGNTPSGGVGATADKVAYAYGGTGGGAHTAGTGGAGGDGDWGSGGGGGGAGTTAGGNGGDGGDGYVVVEVL